MIRRIDQNLTKKIKLDQTDSLIPKRSPTFAEKTMEEKKWIKTEQMLANLKNDPDNEQEYTHYLGGNLRSTHWLTYDSKKCQFGNSSDWDDYGWYTEAEFLEAFAEHWWRRDC